MKSVERLLLESIAAKVTLATHPDLVPMIYRIGDTLIHALKENRNVLIAGNGGSAADAQHFAAELAGQFIHPRKGLPAIALTTNSSILTAIGNDFSFDEIFSRQIEGIGRAGDVFIGITTSGDSQNIILAMEQARKQDITTIGLLGRDGGAVRDICNHALIVPSWSTQHIQECHIMIIHIVCTLIDEVFKTP